MPSHGPHGGAHSPPPSGCDRTTAVRVPHLWRTPLTRYPILPDQRSPAVTPSLSHMQPRKSITSARRLSAPAAICGDRTHSARRPPGRSARSRELTIPSVPSPAGRPAADQRAGLRRKQPTIRPQPASVRRIGSEKGEHSPQKADSGQFSVAH